MGSKFSHQSSLQTMESKYDVFLSFREADTRRTFISHVSRSLDQKGIRTYKDENQQARDGTISPEVALAIRKSNIAVVVISENYASSVWCLDVLAEIIEHSRMTIITVFYEVDPVDLTSPNGKFADDLRRHEERETPETINRWRHALERLESTYPRFCSRDCEDDSKMLDDLIISISSSRFPRTLIRPVGRRAQMSQSHSKVDLESNELRLMSDTYMKHIPKRLPESGETEIYAYHDHGTDMSDESPSPASDDSNGLVGMYRHKKAVYGLLDLESKNSVRTVGIWGDQGVGKTTLAECIFDDISSYFQHHCFLSNVNNIYRNRISPSLLKHLTTTRPSNNIFDAIKPSLVNRNVLLVVDGVHDNHSEQFKDAMKVTRWLGPGSRVIMTSRDDHTLDSCGVKYTYEMGCMRYEEALQLFSLFAFKKTYPLIGFEGFSIRAVQFAGRLPLALKVLGSFLYDKDEESWKTTLRNLETSQDNSSRQVSNYIWACEYLPRHQIDSGQYVRADSEYSPSYHMLL